MYSINLHAHSIFSDGSNTPYVMAMKAKDLGFSALVLTDHIYGSPDAPGMTEAKLSMYKKAIVEAKSILPVIVGCEVPYKGEEVLVFGSTACREILKFGKLESITDLKSRHRCAVILAHPNVHMFDFVEELDGFERYNSGDDYFRGDRRLIDGMPQWCNSDAHYAAGLDSGWNITDKKIVNEDQLIRYIKSGKQPEFYLG